MHRRLADFFGRTNTAKLANQFRKYALFCGLRSKNTTGHTYFRSSSSSPSDIDLFCRPPESARTLTSPLYGRVTLIQSNILHLNGLSNREVAPKRKKRERKRRLTPFVEREDRRLIAGLELYTSVVCARDFGTEKDYRASEEQRPLMEKS